MNRLLQRHAFRGGCDMSREVELLVRSVDDFISGREDMTRPIRRMLSLLKTQWDPEREEPSLAISKGHGGSELTHSHSEQCFYVLQSLMLWLEVSESMTEFWADGEAELLNSYNFYYIENTGQGFQRIQDAPRVSRRMEYCINRVKRKMRMYWVGSSCVHLGDHCVPNALVFLEKYAQIPNLLNPILKAVDFLNNLQDGPEKISIEVAFGDVNNCMSKILQSFFSEGFNGSGGPNRIESGDCIDGRLTSAWNWCSNIKDQPFYFVFVLSGFTGFNISLST
ncbi:unnamed protein product [Choristocarpus tenellus]